MRALRIGTRGSALALWQAEHIAGRLRALSPGRQVELRVIKTRGDKILDVPLAKVGGKGLFVKELEEALLAGEVDLAVHSIKDLPAELPASLGLGAIPEREDPADVVVSREGRAILELPAGARVGTSSLRRRSQLLNLRPDLQMLDLRGNVDTRLRKLQEGEYDAVVLAAAGLRRLGHQDQITQRLTPEEMLPAVGQGALGIETRREDSEVNQLVGRLHDLPTATCVLAERAMLGALGGGCQVPIAGHAVLSAGWLRIDGLIGHPSGSPLFREQVEGTPAAAEQLGEEVARRLLGRGANRILEEVYQQG